MAETREVVITGVGPVAPIGIGRDPFWQALCAGESGIRPIEVFNGEPSPFPYGGEVVDFEGKKYVKPRKSIKVMSREIQLGFASAGLAISDANLDTESLDRDRLGVVLGGDMMFGDLDEYKLAVKNCIVDGKFSYDMWGDQMMSDMYPLWMLKYLPNMAACHIGISVDARGPNNSIVQDETSSLSAMIEAATIIQRGHADVMISGGMGTLVNLTRMVYRGKGEISANLSSLNACRPFDAKRDGMLMGEGAGSLILESREHAEARGANILATMAGWYNCFIGNPDGTCDLTKAVSTSITESLRAADIGADQLSHLNANGLSDIQCDALEAKGIQQAAGDVPVLALKSRFGNLCTGTGAVEAIGTILSLQHQQIPATLNYEEPDPECPVNVVTELTESSQSYALTINQTRYGNAVAIVLRNG